ncbi:hypothetical protein M9458_023528, partial [Cirrhinus mrigala]
EKKTSSVAFALVGAGVAMLLLAICLGGKLQVQAVPIMWIVPVEIRMKSKYCSIRINIPSLV